MVRRPFVLAFVALSLLGFTVAAHAAPASGLATFPDQVVRQYTTMAAGWVSGFQRAAIGTFWLLAFIHLAWQALKLAFRASVLEEFVAEAVSAIMFVGFGSFVLLNGPSLLGKLISSFRVLGMSVGGVGLQPSEIVQSGLELAGEAWHQLSIWDPAGSAGVIIVALVVLLLIAWIAGWMVIALVQAAIYLPVATFFMAFWGSYWTKEIAIAMMRQGFALGAKLMMLELLAGASVQMLHSMLHVLDDFTGFNAGVVIASAFVLALLVKVLPDWIGHVVGGHYALGEGNAIVAAAGTAAGAAAGGAAGVAGALPLAGEAVRLGAAQTAANDATRVDSGQEPRSRMARIAATTGYGIKNVGSAVASDVGRRLSGQGARFGSPTWRMAADLQNRRRLLNDDLTKPKPPRGS